MSLTDSPGPGPGIAARRRGSNCAIEYLPFMAFLRVLRIATKYKTRMVFPSNGISCLTLCGPVTLTVDISITNLFQQLLVSRSSFRIFWASLELSILELEAVTGHTHRQTDPMQSVICKIILYGEPHNKCLLT